MALKQKKNRRFFQKSFFSLDIVLQITLSSKWCPVKVPRPRPRRSTRGRNIAKKPKMPRFLLSAPVESDANFSKIWSWPGSTTCTWLVFNLSINAMQNFTNSLFFRLILTRLTWRTWTANFCSKSSMSENRNHWSQKNPFSGLIQTPRLWPFTILSWSNS